MKKIIFLLLVLISVSDNFSQNITNTLGASGLFSIKDGSTTFMSLSQATGNLSLNKNIMMQFTISSSEGIIFKYGLRFIHDFFDPATYGGNTFVGLNSGNFTMGGSLGQGSYNTGMGLYTLNSLTNGYGNSAFGLYALYGNTSGNQNTADGASSLAFNSLGSYNTAAGANSLYNNSSGFGNSAFGHSALLGNSTGNNNSAFGNSSLTSNTTGYPNSAFGAGALYNNTTGKENTAVGYSALLSNVSGFQNTAVGDSALYNNIGNYNTALGYNAGSNVTTGANLTLIGIDANPSSPTAIDQITLGNQFVSLLRCNVQTITSLSDSRDKKNIQDLTLGLDFITKLKPRQFNWDRRDWYEGNISDGSKTQETPTAGFIAQEFDEIQKSENAEWLNLVLKDNPEKWEATYGNLLPVMVKAIQELAINNEKLKIKNEELEDRLAKFEEMQNVLVKKIEQLDSNEQLFKIQIVKSENNNY